MRDFAWTQELRELDYQADCIADMWLDGERSEVLREIREHARSIPLAVLVAGRIAKAGPDAHDVSLALHLLEVSS